MKYKDLQLYSDAGKWLLKLLFILAFYFIVAVFLSLLFAKITPSVSLTQTYIHQSFDQLHTFSRLYTSIGLPNTIVLVIVILLFSYFNVSKEYFISSLPSMLRDFTVVYLFTAVSTQFFAHYQLDNQVVNSKLFEIYNPNYSSDFYVLASLITNYFILATSNFGKVIENGLDTFKELIVIVLILGIGQFMFFPIQVNFLYFYHEYIFQVLLVYMIGNVLKLFFYHDEILSVRFRNTPSKIGFFLVLFLLGWSLAGITFSLFVLLFFYIFSLATPLVLVANSLFSVVFAYLFLTSSYLLHLLFNKPLQFVFFISAIVFFLGKYADRNQNIYKDYPFNFKKSYSYAVLRSVPFEYKEELSIFAWTIGVLSILSLYYFA